MYGACASDMEAACGAANQAFYQFSEIEDGAVSWRRDGDVPTPCLPLATNFCRSFCPDEHGTAPARCEPVLPGRYPEALLEQAAELGRILRDVESGASRDSQAQPVEPGRRQPQQRCVLTDWPLFLVMQFDLFTKTGVQREVAATGLVGQAALGLGPYQQQRRARHPLLDQLMALLREGRFRQQLFEQ